MGDYNIDFRWFIWMGALIVLGLWGLSEIIDFLFIDEVIKSHSKIIPEIELVVKNNIVDTIYIYRKP